MTVVLQRGHVPRRTGATGAPGEQAFAIAVCDAAATMLTAAGFPVRLIDADEPNHRYRGDLFAAVHYDSSSSPDVAGASVGWQGARDAAGHRLARTWRDAYVHAGYRGPWLADNYTPNLAGYYGVRRAREQGNPAAIILEAGFGSHRTEGPWLRSTSGIGTVARSIRDAVAATLGRGYVPPARTAPTVGGIMVPEYAQPSVSKALRAGVFTEHTKLDRPVDAADLAVFLDRAGLIDEGARVPSWARDVVTAAEADGAIARGTAGRVVRRYDLLVIGDRRYGRR